MLNDVLVYRCSLIDVRIDFPLYHPTVMDLHVLLQICYRRSFLRARAYSNLDIYFKINEKIFVLSVDDRSGGPIIKISERNSLESG